eukprot:CAMPEP_0196816186 /NCGR_PEP_ID=MMETSP1362-20130617/53983_1 /TAXON_ID=163516 /ORGANISM="Leptocylindrus danicus, Strain CCMP1856" /LENGTH=82 /DNA_ID=CAMNT_0042193417 /DNA_START=126 /DNA_END=374 /DNA_ORIENTATION=+
MAASSVEKPAKVTPEKVTLFSLITLTALTVSLLVIVQSMVGHSISMLLEVNAPPSLASSVTPGQMVKVSPPSLSRASVVRDA